MNIKMNIKIHFNILNNLEDSIRVRDNPAPPKPAAFVCR